MFQLGDKVVVHSNYYHNYEEGMIGIVEEIFPSEKCIVRPIVRLLYGDTDTISSQIIKYSDLELVKDVPPLQVVGYSKQSGIPLDWKHAVLINQELYSIDEAVRCSVCNRLALKDNCQKIDGEYVCELCEDNICECADCGALTITERYRNDGGEDICYSCSQQYIMCSQCGDIINIDNALAISNGDLICRNCYNEDFFTCEECGEIYHNDESYYRNDCCYCRYCYRNSCGPIEEYSYKPDPIFYPKGEKKYVGFEIEVECSDSDHGYYANKILEIVGKDRLYFKEDGSLDDGFEIISHPIIPEMVEEVTKLSQWTRMLIEDGYRSHDTRTCGLHFHFSREWFNSNTAIAKVISTIETFQNDFQKVGRRKFGGCACKISEDTWSREDFLRYTTDYTSRYVTVNLRNEHTVEFRFMRGTLNSQTILASIDFLKCLIENINHLDWDDLTPNNFLKGINDNTLAYLQRRGAFSDYVTSRDTNEESL